MVLVIFPELRITMLSTTLFLSTAIAGAHVRVSEVWSQETTEAAGTSMQATLQPAAIRLMNSVTLHLSFFTFVIFDSKVMPVGFPHLVAHFAALGCPFFPQENTLHEGMRLHCIWNAVPCLLQCLQIASFCFTFHVRAFNSGKKKCCCYYCRILLAMYKARFVSSSHCTQLELTVNVCAHTTAHRPLAGVVYMYACIDAKQSLRCWRKGEK